MLEDVAVVFSDRTQGGLKILEEFVGTTLPQASKLEELATGYLPPITVRSPLLNVALRQPVIFPTLNRVYRPGPFDARPPALPKRSLLRLQTYFQDQSWFDKSLSVVLREIEVSNHDERVQYRAFDLCVHLRRGDYISHGYDLSFQYYEEALKLLANSSISSVVVNSDDRLAASVFCELLRTRGYDAHASSNVKPSLRETSKPVSPAMRDFWLMANAKNLLMSNSSFCWWAAVFGDSLLPGRQSRFVAYPVGWVGMFGDGEDGLIQPTWTPVAAGLLGESVSRP
jgi:hypothetical protein